MDATYTLSFSKDKCQFEPISDIHADINISIWKDKKYHYFINRCTFTKEEVDKWSEEIQKETTKVMTGPDLFFVKPFPKRAGGNITIWFPYYLTNTLEITNQEGKHLYLQMSDETTNEDLFNLIREFIGNRIIEETWKDLPDMKTWWK